MNTQKTNCNQGNRIEWKSNRCEFWKGVLHKQGDDENVGLYGKNIAEIS